MSTPKPSESGVVARRPSDDEVRALYDAHREYAAARPWEALPDDQPLVIHNTLRRRTGYLAVHRDGATYYQGNRGLLHYLRADGAVPNLSDCVNLFYRSAAQVNSREIARLVKLDVAAGAGGQWPLFRSILSYHMEWPPGAEQTQAMAYALRQAALAARHIRRGPSVPRSRDPERPPLAPIWTTAPGTNGVLEWMALPGLDQLAPRHPNYEPEFTANAGRLPATRETWSLSPIALPFPMYETAYQEARPQYPVAVVVAAGGDAPKQLTLLDLKRHTVDREQSVFLQAMLMLERRPAEVLVSYPTTADALRPLEDTLGFRVRVVADIPFDYEDIRPLVEQMQQTVINDSRHTHAVPAWALLKPDRRELPGDGGDPLVRRHTAAALVHGLYHNPQRDVVPPENLAGIEYFAPDMTPAEALWTMAAVNGGWANLEIAARMFTEAGVGGVAGVAGVTGNGERDADALLTELRRLVADDDGWEESEVGAAYSARAAAETELPRRRSAPEPAGPAPEPEPAGPSPKPEPAGPAPARTRRGRRPRGEDAPLVPVAGLRPGMSAFDVLEAVADDRGPEVEIREVARQMIAAGISRSKDPQRVAINVRATVRKRPDWTMIGGGRARRGPAPSESET